MMGANAQAVKELQDSCASYIAQFDNYLSQKRNTMEAELLSFCSQQHDFKSILNVYYRFKNGVD
jgi:hypothetical protein